MYTVFGVKQLRAEQVPHTAAVALTWVPRCFPSPPATDVLEFQSHQLWPWGGPAFSPETIQLYLVPSLVVLICISQVTSDVEYL